jgi:transcriptional regulator with XRE-family HTH domain
LIGIIMILNQQLKLLLNNKDITVAQLSRATAVPAKTIYHWLHGQSPRNLVQVKKIADYFGVTLDYLLFGQLAPVAGIDTLKNDILAGVFEVVLRKVKNP